MEKAKSIVLEFSILWFIIFLLAAIAVVLGVSDVGLGDFMIVSIGISIIQTFIVGFRKRFAIFIIPFFVLFCQCCLLFSYDPLGEGMETAVDLASLFSPFFDRIIMDNLSSFPFSTRKFLVILDCTILTVSYLVLELMLARYIITKTGLMRLESTLK